jgi:hypothetical protein
MSKSAEGASSVSKGRTRLPEQGPGVLDLFAEEGAPGSLSNSHLGKPLPSEGAILSGQKRMFEPEPTASVDAEDTVGQLLHSLGVGLGVPIDNSLKNHPALVRALEFALRPNPKVEDGNDVAAGAAALSVIIGCARQEKRAQLVSELLVLGLGTWPLSGCVFDLALRPPLLAALQFYDTFEDPSEWQEMFDALAKRGDLDTCYGPELLTAETVYFDKFQKNYAPESSGEGEEDTVGQLLHSLGVGLGVPIDNSLKNHPALVRALEFALRPNPTVEDGNDQAAGAAALSVIIGCARQEKRAQLVSELLVLGLGTWPLSGCVFDLALRPPLLAALQFYDTFEDPAEWQEMFDALAERGDLDTCYGPELLTAETVYFDMFQKNYAPESSGEGEAESSDEGESESSEEVE